MCQNYGETKDFQIATGKSMTFVYYPGHLERNTPHSQKLSEKKWTGIADVFCAQFNKVFETKQLEFPHPNRQNFIWFPSPAVGYSVMLDHNLQFPNSQNLKRGSKFLFLTDSLILKTTSPNEWHHEQYLHINSRRGPIGMLRKKG